MPDFIEKYLKVSDFIKALIESRKYKQITILQLQEILLKLLVEMQQYLDYEEIFSLMFKYKMLDILFEFAENVDVSDESRENFAVEFFRYTLTYDLLDMTILVIDHYKMELLRNTNNCVESIVQAFEKNSQQARLKCHILQVFIDYLKFTHIERFLSAIEGFITGDQNETYLVTNVNPILTGTLIKHTLFVLSERYPASEFRSELLIEMMTA